MTNAPNAPAYRVEIRTSRAPYRRAGIAFASTRETVSLWACTLSEEQFRKLTEDPALTVELVEVNDAPAEYAGGVGATQSEAAPPASPAATVAAQAGAVPPAAPAIAPAASAKPKTPKKAPAKPAAKKES